MRAWLMKSIRGYPFLFPLYSTIALANTPLVVVVETNAEGGLSPLEIRTAVARELSREIRDPASPATDGNEEALLVAIRGNEASLSFHPGMGPARHRRIALPETYPDRIRTLAWASMNLTTDQTTGLLGDEEKSMSEPLLLTPPPTKPTEEEAPQARTAEAVPSDPIEPGIENTVSAQAAHPSPAYSGWTLSVFAGPSMGFMGAPTPHRQPTLSPWRRDGLEYQLELQGPVRGWRAGVALDMGVDPVIACAGFLGDGWKRGRLRLDATVGVGLELAQRWMNTTRNRESADNGIVTTMETSSVLRPTLYGRGNLTLLWTLPPSFALSMRVALHLASDDVVYSYGAALIGARLNLP